VIFFPTPPSGATQSGPDHLEKLSIPNIGGIQYVIANKGTKAKGNFFWDVV
jgi:hypothetical protein